MNKIFIVVILCLFKLSLVIAQDTISLEEGQKLFNSDEEFPENISFLKDTNNTLSKFLGTWSGTFNQKKYRFTVSKFVYYNEFTEVYIDKLKTLYEITDLEGNIIDEVFDPSFVLVPEGVGIGINSNGYAYDFAFYSGKECRDRGTMIFRFSPTNFNPNRLSLVFYETGDATRNCTGELKYTLPLLFKGEELILTK